MATNYKINTTDLIDVFYPVGTIYETEDSSFNPNTAWGGTWGKIKDKFLVAAGSTYTGTGGAASVTLTTDNLPSHNHSFTPSGSVSVSSNPTYSGTKITGFFWGFNNSSYSGSGVFTKGSTGNTMRENHNYYGMIRYDFSYTPSGTISGGSYSFTGSAGNTGDKGDGNSFNILPPYRTVFIWERTA